MSWKNSPSGTGRRAVFKRLVVGSPVHDAFMRWVQNQYIRNIRFVNEVIENANREMALKDDIVCRVLLEKVASPLIYLEMDWHNLSDKEKIPFARGAYAEQLTRRIQEANRTVNQAQSETNW